MSWSLNIEARVDRDELKSAVENAQPGDDVSDAVEAQVRSAKKVACDLIDAEAVGNADDKLSVQLGGHTGPVGEFVNVRVGQVS